MIEDVVVGAALIVYAAYVAYNASTSERRRRWRERNEASGTGPGELGDPSLVPLVDDGGGHHDHGHLGDHSIEHDVDFDAGGGHHD